MFSRAECVFSQAGSEHHLLSEGQEMRFVASLRVADTVEDIWPLGGCGLNTAYLACHDFVKLRAASAH